MPESSSNIHCQKLCLYWKFWHKLSSDQQKCRGGFCSLSLRSVVKLWPFEGVWTNSKPIGWVWLPWKRRLESQVKDPVSGFLLLEQSSSFAKDNFYLNHVSIRMKTGRLEKKKKNKMCTKSCRIGATWSQFRRYADYFVSKWSATTLLRNVVKKRFSPFTSSFVLGALQNDLRTDKKKSGRAQACTVSFL